MTPTWAIIAVACIAALPGIIAVFRIQQVHLSLNSRLDEWKAETAAKIVAAHAQGRQAERDSVK
jgi:hypothetical protein